MNLDLWLTLALKLLDLFRTVDLQAPASDEITKEIEQATDLSQVHAAITKLRKKVTP